MICDESNDCSGSINEHDPLTVMKDIGCQAIVCCKWITPQFGKLRALKQHFSKESKYRNQSWQIGWSWRGYLYGQLKGLYPELFNVPADEKTIGMIDDIHSKTKSEPQNSQPIAEVLPASDLPVLSNPIRFGPSSVRRDAVNENWNETKLRNQMLQINLSDRQPLSPIQVRRDQDCWNRLRQDWHTNYSPWFASIVILWLQNTKILVSRSNLNDFKVVWMLGKLK